MHAKLLVHERLFDRLEPLTVAEVCALLRCHEMTCTNGEEETAHRYPDCSRLKSDPADIATFIASRRTS